MYFSVNTNEKRVHNKYRNSKKKVGIPNTMFVRNSRRDRLDKNKNSKIGTLAALTSAAIFFRDSVGDSNRTGLYDFRSGVGLETGVHTGGSSADGGDDRRSSGRVLRGGPASRASGDLCLSSGDQTPAQTQPFPLAPRCGLRASADSEISSKTSHTMHMLDTRDRVSVVCGGLRVD